jgi:DNA-binding transcriptional regulator YiaG
MNKKKYQSEALMVIHQSVEGAYKLGLATDEEMQYFDNGCLVAEPELAFSKSPNSQSRPIIPAYARTKA